MRFLCVIFFCFSCFLGTKSADGAKSLSPGERARCLAQGCESILNEIKPRFSSTAASILVSMPGLGKGCEPRGGVLGAPTCLGCPRSFGSLLTVSLLCKEGEDTAYILVLGGGPGYRPHAMAWDRWHPFGPALAGPALADVSSAPNITVWERPGGTRSALAPFGGRWDVRGALSAISPAPGKCHEGSSGISGQVPRGFSLNYRARDSFWETQSMGSRG